MYLRTCCIVFVVLFLFGCGNGSQNGQIPPITATSPPVVVDPTPTIPVTDPTTPSITTTCNMDRLAAVDLAGTCRPEGGATPGALEVVPNT